MILPRLLAAFVVALGMGPGGTFAQVAPPSTSPAKPEVTLLKGLASRFLLAPNDVSLLGKRLLPSFDVSKRERLLITIERKNGGRNLVVPDIVTGVLTDDDPALEAFCRTPDGTLVAIAGGKLCTIESGRLAGTVALPSPGMSIAAGETDSHFFVYGGAGPAASLVFEVLEGARYRKLVEAPGPVGALAEIAGTLYIATGATILALRPGEPPAVVFEPPTGTAAITSIAGDATGRILFFATMNGVHALRGQVAARILAGCGGQILLRDGALYVCDAGRGVILVVDNAVRGLTESAK
jgi:hypothetical protein